MGKRDSRRIKLYEESNIIDELNYTYEQLLEQRDYIDKVSKFHKQLTDSISNGSNLQDIADLTYKLLGIPISIEDLSFQKIAYSGLEEDEYTWLNNDLKENLFKQKRRNHSSMPIFHQTTRVKTALQTSLITPIIVQRKIIGYCTFLNIAAGKEKEDKHIMFLERAANAASLYLLNEKNEL